MQKKISTSNNADEQEQVSIDANKSKRKSVTKYIARAGMIAALYVALTLVAAPISFGPIQFRISEAMVILPLVMPEAIAGLTIGCLISNTMSSPWDMLLGTTATLIASVLTYLCGRAKLPALGWLPPVILNALVVPVIFILTDTLEGIYWFNVATVGGGELAVAVVLGIPLYVGLNKVKKRNPALFM